ncbi:MAG: NADH-quinone oxidoreductase subunit NuoE [Pseudomonadota bacterium]
MRRLHSEQPESFAFTPANAHWASQQIAKYPDGRQASAVIPLLWRGQEQEGWVSRPMIEEVARMLDMAEIRVLEVATFYFMFQLQPVGSVAHIQVCGTTSCMICGAEDLIGVCKEKIAANPHELSADGKFSWEEVECLGACSNAPMAQIGKDYYEDLTVESLSALIDGFAKGDVPTPGPQNGRYASEPLAGLTSLTGEAAHSVNASLDIAAQQGDTVKRIDGSEPVAIWGIDGPSQKAPDQAPKTAKRAPKAAKPDRTDQVSESPLEPAYIPKDDDKPDLLTKARGGVPDDLKKIKGIGPKLETLCNTLGVWHFDQIASWSDKEVAWVDHHLEGFKGRVSRDEWVAQAKILAAGGETEFSKSRK